MITIVLCDDNVYELSVLKKMIQEHFNTIGEECTFRTFPSSKILEFELEDSGRGDLYILDIDMPEIDGITLAVKIHSLYPHAILFFYTSHIEYATEGYRVEARRYLLKGGNPAFFTEALDYAVQEIRKVREECINITAFKDTINLPIAEIQYVQREGRALVIYTQTQGRITVYESIKSLHQRIGKPYFVFIDRGTFVNINYIRRTDHNTVALFNGVTLGMSRNRAFDVKQAIAKYWRM